MALLSGTRVIKNYTHSPTLLGNDMWENESVRDMGLARLNVVGGQNDVQMKAVFDRYDLWDKLCGK